MKEIRLTNVLNPTEGCIRTSGIEIESYGDDNFTHVRGKTSLLPSLSCTGLCIGCIQDKKDYCTACEKNFYLTDGACTEQCPPRTFLSELSNSCEACDDNCKACTGVADNCVSCTDAAGVSKDGHCISR